MRNVRIEFIEDIISYDIIRETPELKAEADRKSGTQDTEIEHVGEKKISKKRNRGAKKNRVEAKRKKVGEIKSDKEALKLIEEATTEVKESIREKSGSTSVKMVYTTLKDRESRRVNREEEEQGRSDIKERDRVENIKESTEVKEESTKGSTGVKEESTKGLSSEVQNKQRGTGILETAPINTTNTYLKQRDKLQKEEEEREKRELARKDINFPYKAVNLLTSAELQLFNFMLNNLHNKERIYILTKVRVADLINVDTRITQSQDPFWKISSKHVDYVICEKDTMKVICVVELDDYTHDEPGRRERDMFVMHALREAGIETARIQTKIAVISKEDLRYTEYLINKYFAPVCQWHNELMSPNEALRTKHRFYRCPVPSCGYTIDIDEDMRKLNLPEIRGER